MTSLPLTYIDAAATASLEPDDQPLQTSYLATDWWQQDIQRIAWKLIFETDCARPPGLMESRQKMILDVLNRRVPPLTEEEANLDRRADDLLRRSPPDMRQRSA